MMKIEVNFEETNGLKKRYFKNKTFSHVTGNQIKLFPFKTNPSGDSFTDDFKSFQGVIGELFRILNSKTQVDLGKNNNLFKIDLKETILNTAIDKVATQHVEEFKHMITKLFFDDDHGLIKFNMKTLSYMNFIDSNNAVKEISKFIYDVFLIDFNHKTTLNEDNTDENLLHQLIIQCLPELPEIILKPNSSRYINLFPQIKQQFVEDFTYLSSNNTFLLKHVEDFFKYYYFHYLNQLLLQLKDFGVGISKVRPIYYTMDWETLSEARLASHSIGWKQLNKYSESTFAHANALELLNYIIVDGKSIGDYANIVNLYTGFSNDERGKFQECVSELITFYTDSITVFETGKNWDDCERLLEFALIKENFKDEFYIKIYTLWFKIKYQFENSSRSKPYSDYSKWYSQFGKVNYTKNRGRLGNTTVLSQELLLFLTRLCIGSEDKIRLKTLWDKFKDRGIIFDEPTKLEITKLFEKINLIEKKVIAEMHNTSSQLYKYVSNLIIEFFVAQKIQAGDRYNLYLEDKEHIDFLYDSLQHNSLIAYEPFTYTHPDGGEVYSTFSLSVEGTKVIIASSTFASEDYFTMIRNKVADQNEVFEGTAILILFSGKLDSLLGGSGSLIKEGMPLHYSRFKNKIENDIESTTSLHKHEKIILKSVLDKKTKSVVEDNNSIFDYEQVINSLQKDLSKKRTINI